MRRVLPASVFFLLDHVVAVQEGPVRGAREEKNSRVNSTTFPIINEYLIRAG